MKRLTDTEKSAIESLRAAGLGYKAIAEKLSLSRETVRSFCARNGLQAAKPVDASDDGEEPADMSNDGEKTEIKQGDTLFIISTAHSKTATETLLEKLEKLILDAAQKLSLCSRVFA